MRLKDPRTRQIIVLGYRLPSYSLIIAVAAWIGGPDTALAEDGLIGPSSSASSVITLTIPPRLSVQVTPQGSGASRTTTPNFHVTSNLGDIGYSLHRIEWKGGPRNKEQKGDNVKSPNTKVVTYIILPQE